ncbi:hypothetical protein OKA04_07555 [Luteolibacter flavescens]|uniref:DUF4034 domain-containing protein n=1 Tax=Luteolibacter flavescens TaxID=1859460 RepID=A0ABT3FN05_9BACT|nr:hypothetical protein [Luteolibacter flavescens]MCW1884584.1 hypothetical protein [Luteolibacter flavescens]
MIFISGLMAGGLGGWLMGRQAEAAAAGAEGGGSASSRGSAFHEGSSSAGPAGRTRPRGQSREETREFADSVRSIFRDSVENRRLAKFERMLERIEVADYPTVLALIRESDLRGCGNAGEWSRIWESWGRRDPASALAFIQSPEFEGWNEAAKGEARNRTLLHWAETDPASALQHVEASPEMARGDRSLVYGLVRGWSNVDPKAAAEWIFRSGLGMSGEYGAIVDGISRQGGQEDLDEWFAGIQKSGAPAKDIEGFANRIAEVKRSFEPDKAAAWLEQNLDEPWVEQNGIVASTASAFAERSPAEAMEWAGRTGMESATIHAMNTWCQRDHQAAGEWILGNVGAPGHAASVQVYANFLWRRDQDAARAWAQRIDDPTLRARVLDSIPEGVTPGG